MTTLNDQTPFAADEARRRAAAADIDLAAPQPDAPAAPPPAPDPPDAPLSWRPLGGELKYALEVESAIKRNGRLRLALATARPAQAESDAFAERRKGEARARVLGLLQASDGYGRLRSLRPQYRAAVAADAEAAATLAKAKDRQAALARMTPPPTGLASRLVKAQSDVEQASAEAEARGAELAALTPVYREAERQVRAELARLCKQAHEEGRAAARAEQLELLRSLAEAEREALTKLYLLKMVASNAKPEDPAELARLVLESPDDDEAGQ